MKLEQWVLFIDMLGYGHLNSKINTDEEAEELLSFMKDNVGIFKQQKESAKVRKLYNGEFNLEDYYDIEIVFISDSLVINYNPKELIQNINSFMKVSHSANAMIMILLRLQAFLWNCISKKGIFVRGGISNKYCKVRDNFAVGAGLIEAYNIESKVAIYPRICFAKSVTDNSSLMLMFRWLFQQIYYLDTVDLDRSTEAKIYSVNYVKFQLGVLKSLSMQMQKMRVVYESRRILKKVAPEEYYSFMKYKSSDITEIDIDNFNKHMVLQVRIFFNFIRTHKLEIEKNIRLFSSKPDNDSVKVKYLWLKNMHNDSIDYFFASKYSLYQDKIKDFCFKEILASFKIL